MRIFLKPKTSLRFGVTNRETLVALSSHAPLNIDDFYEYYDPNEESELVTSRQEHNNTPDSQKFAEQSQPSRQRSKSPFQGSETKLQAQRSPSPPSRPPTSSSNRLRRTPRLPERRPSLVRATSLPPTFEVFQQVAPDPIRPVRPTTAQEEEDSLPERPFAPSEASSDQFQRIVSDKSFWPRRTTQISQSTHEAILFAIEAVRRGRGNNYWTFTPDLVEENASMSDLAGGRTPAGPSARQNGGSRAASGPVPVSERTPERLRTPTDVMRHRRARIAREEAEKEASRVQQLEERERRRRELELEPNQQRRSGGRRSGTEPQFDARPQAPAEGSSQRRSGGWRSGGDPQADPQAAQPATAVKDNLRDPAAAPTTRQRGTSQDQGQPRPVQTQTEPRITSNAPATASRRSRTEPARGANVDSGDHGQRAAPSEQPRVRTQVSNQPPQQSQTQTSQPQQQQRAAFPHAFERWETLSSHWEGLTSYWIRRLQENSNELSREPLSQQMSRQITDLSAAGANLFHAVVELQRLRASSERKFQRWFFEHRTDQEKFQDTQAQLERTLQTERQNREEALATANGAQAQASKAEELVKEMRRELQISKEEARRAWEELGRREQVEREWTVSLQNGQPTIVGGVQVVPMTQGVPSRRTSNRERPPTREGPYPGGPGSGSMGGQRPQDAADYSDVYEGQALPPASSPTETDPFSATDPNQPAYAPEEFYARTQPPTSSAAIAARTAVSPPGSYPAAHQPSRFYQQTDPNIQAPTTEPSVSDTGRSYIPSNLSAASDEDAFEYEIDAHGNPVFDSHGRRIPYRGPKSDEGSDPEGDLRAEIERDRLYRERYGQPPSSAAYQVPAPAPDVPTSSGSFDPPTSQVDYSGQAWGSGWENITPRHRHPTRLSDVLEEDERSRATSPTRTSYVGSGAESGPASTRLVGIREEEHQPSNNRTGGNRGGRGR
ncbi:MAG: hypothetical protein Q9160_003844 [Pyrenula sp. 1 TL-2023]